MLKIRKAYYIALMVALLLLPAALASVSAVAAAPKGIELRNGADADIMEESLKADLPTEPLAEQEQAAAAPPPEPATPTAKAEGWLMQNLPQLGKTELLVAGIVLILIAVLMLILHMLNPSRRATEDDKQMAGLSEVRTLLEASQLADTGTDGISIDANLAKSLSYKGAKVERGENLSIEEQEEAKLELARYFFESDDMASKRPPISVLERSLKKGDEKLKPRLLTLLRINKLGLATGRGFPASHYYNMGDDLYRIGNLADALRCFNKAVFQSASSSRNYLARANIRHLMGEYDTALQDYERAIDLNSTDYMARLNRASLYASFRRYEDALRDCNQGIHLNPSYPWGYHTRGDIYYGINKPTEALEEYKVGLRLMADYHLAHFRFALMYQSLGRKKDAIESFSSCINADETYVDGYMARGVLYAKMGEFSKAVADYRSAVEVDPDYKEAYYNIAEMYLTGMQFDQVISVLNDNSERFTEPRDMVVSGYLMILATVASGLDSSSLVAAFDKMLLENPGFKLQNWDFNEIAKFFSDVEKEQLIPKERLAMMMVVHKKLKELC